MKARILIMAFMVAFTSFATAQEKKAGKKFTPEQRIEFRVKKMQDKLMLDEAEAAKFAPLYKEYLAEKAKCRPAVERGKDLTDEQMMKNMEACMDARQKALDVDKEYFGKFSKILNAKQMKQVFGKKEGFGKFGKNKFAPGKEGKGKGQGKATRGKMKNRKGDCKKNDCKKADCKKDDCKKADCKKADCPKK